MQPRLQLSTLLVQLRLLYEVSRLHRSLCIYLQTQVEKKAVKPIKPVAKPELKSAPIIQSSTSSASEESSEELEIDEDDDDDDDEEEEQPTSKTTKKPFITPTVKEKKQRKH
jgi:hypothetical protein